MGSHTFEEHVGEVYIRIEGSTLSELFAEAARAFAELVTGDLAAGRGAVEGGGPARRVVLRGRGREGLLVAFLDELVFRTEVDGTVYPDAQVVRIEEDELEASLRAAPAAVPRVHVKAATFHDLAIRETPRGLSATVVLDV